MRSEGYRLMPRLWAVVICLIAFTLLVYQLDEKSLWGDEAYTARTVRGSLQSVVAAVAWEGYPPIYYVGIWFWRKFAGDTEFALRFPSVIFAMLSVAVLYPLGTRMMNSKAGLTAAGLMAISPFLMLYARMARYYTLLLFLSLMTYWFFNQLFKRPNTIANWEGYILTSTLLMYTHYLAAAVFAAQALVALTRARRHRHFVLGLIASQVVVILLFSPWLGVMIQQAARLGARPDPFAGNSLAMWLLSAAYPFVAWMIGESLYPWNPAAVVGAILVVWLGVRGLLSATKIVSADTPDEADSSEGALRQPPKHHRLSYAFGAAPFWTSQAFTVLLFILVPLSLTIITIRQFISGASFLGVPSRAIFCMPFISLLIGCGVWTITHRAGRLLAATLLSIVLGLSLRNYYLGREFHNPNYVLQIEGLAKSIAEQAQPGDVFVSDFMTAFEYYINEKWPEAAHFLAHSPEEAQRYIAQHQAPRVWLILLCRAVETESLATAELVPWLLEEGYSLELARGYGPLDETYTRLQEFILGKPACKYKVVLYRYAPLQRELVGAAQ